MMRFYGYFRSSAAYRCRIAFNLKGIETELVPIHLRKDGGQHKATSYRAINPQALAPTLDVDGTLLTQSLAIIEWLEETYPEPALLPSDPMERAQVRAFAQISAIDIHPLANLRVLDYLKTDLKLEQPAVDAWCQRWIGDGLAACETLLARRPVSGDFAFGKTPTLADICLMPQLYSADRFGVDLTAMPRLRAIRAACDALPAFAGAHPARQPDADA